MGYIYRKESDRWDKLYTKKWALCKIIFYRKIVRLKRFTEMRVESITEMKGSEKKGNMLMYDGKKMLRIRFRTV
jgi:hypothetical protein